MPKHSKITKDLILEKIKKYHDLGTRLPSTSGVKEQLIHFGLLVNECAICKCSNSWQGKPLSLHLDHIDGDATNNVIENYRLLCPNCHSQTDTYCGKNNKGKKATYKKNVCKDCNRELKSWVINCGFCANEKIQKEGLKILEEFKILGSIQKIAQKLKISNKTVEKRLLQTCKMNISQIRKNYNIPNTPNNIKVIIKPNKEELEDLLKSNTIAAIGRKYNVSHNAIKKWMKKLKIT